MASPQLLAPQLLTQVAPEIEELDITGVPTMQGLDFPFVPKAPVQTPLIPQFTPPRQEGGFWSKLLQVAPLILAQASGNPQVIQTVNQLVQGNIEQQRKKKAAAEVQFISSTLEQALLSNDMDGFAKTIQQLNKMENFEPEAVQFASKTRLEMADLFGKRRRETDAMSKLGRVLANRGQTPEQLMSEIAQIPGIPLQMVDDITKMVLSTREAERKQILGEDLSQLVAISDFIPKELKPFYQNLAKAEPDKVHALLQTLVQASLKEQKGPFATRPLKEKVVSALSALKAGKEVPPELFEDLRSFGIDPTDEAQLKMVQKEMAEPGLSVQMSNLGIRREQFERIPHQDRRMLSESRASFNQLEKIADLFEKTPAFKTGKVSSVLRAAFSINLTARFFSDLNLLPVGKLKDEEVEFANAYNALLIKLRSFSGDPRFSDQDALRTIQGLGTGILGKQFPGQLRAAKDFIAELSNSVIEDLEASGFNVKGIRRLSPSSEGEASSGASVILRSGKKVVVPD